MQTKRFPGQKIHAAMGIADLDFRTAPVITEAITKRVLHENWGYILTPDSYYESIINWIKKDMAKRFQEINSYWRLVFSCDSECHQGILS
ncbi:MAG: hypothetical protein Ct9H90mP13_06950 [Pseudomonadota bacterium]|nr:MAG: hypothetical protein Ct9H90mP13_06950 [Pseudomonadota bacterium]